MAGEKLLGELLLEGPPPDMDDKQKAKRSLALRGRSAGETPALPGELRGCSAGGMRALYREARSVAAPRFTGFDYSRTSPPLERFSLVNTRDLSVCFLGTSPFFSRICRADSMASLPPVGYSKLAARIPWAT